MTALLEYIDHLLGASLGLLKLDKSGQLLVLWLFTYLQLSPARLPNAIF